MKKFFLIIVLLFGLTHSLNAETKRIVSGKIDANIKIIAYESLTCSHCANFHKNVYPQLKKDFIDTGLAKIEFRHFPLDIAEFLEYKMHDLSHVDSSPVPTVFH